MATGIETTTTGIPSIIAEKEPDINSSAGMLSERSKTSPMTTGQTSDKTTDPHDSIHNSEATQSSVSSSPTKPTITCSMVVRSLLSKLFQDTKHSQTTLIAPLLESLLAGETPSELHLTLETPSGLLSAIASSTPISHNGRQ